MFTTCNLFIDTDEIAIILKDNSSNKWSKISTLPSRIIVRHFIDINRISHNIIDIILITYSKDSYSY